MPTGGLWCGRLSQVGQTDWFTFPVRGNRIFTVVTQALDETGAPSNSKAMPSIGVWDAFDPAGAAAVGAAPGLNGLATGETWLRVASNGDDIVRIGIADLRGDGRPDYAYNGWVLYADTVSPAHLPASGGPITIQGMGFRLADTVLVGGQPALVTSISPNQITAIAPPAASGVTGSVDVEVDDQPTLYAAAIIPGGVSYDSGTGDALTLVTAPSGTVPIGVPIPFTVTALDPALAPAGGVTVIYTVTSGTATLACGLPVCSGHGHRRRPRHHERHRRQRHVVHHHRLAHQRLQACRRSLPAELRPRSPRSRRSFRSPPAPPSPGPCRRWSSRTAFPSPASRSHGKLRPAAASRPRLRCRAHQLRGIATKTLTVGPLAEGQVVSINACLNGTSQCVAFTAYGARPEHAMLEPISGTSQTLAASGTPSQIALRLLDMDGNPMAGGTVALYQALYAWSPPCSPHTVCAQGALLATQAATATSAIDGSVTFLPVSLPGVATNLLGLAASGNTATVNIAIEQHP